MVLEISGNYSIILPVLDLEHHRVPHRPAVSTDSAFDQMTREDGLDLPSMEESREQTAFAR